MPEARSSPSAARNRRLLVRLARVCMILVLAITTLSAAMRLTKAGVGCAPWPQCYGQAASQSAGGADPAPLSDALVAERLAHRVLALAALALIVVMLALALRAGPGLGRERLETALLLAVTLFLAVLGRLGAQSPLPAIALGNLLGGFAMLALCLRLAARRPVAAGGFLRAGLWLVFLLLLAQVLLGGMASATQSILDCQGWVECAQAIQGQSWGVLDPWRRPEAAGAAAGAPVQWLHRLGAIVVLLAGLALAWALRHHDARGAALLAVGLLAQFALGTLLAASGFAFGLVLLHNVLAALLLALVARWL